MSTSRLQRYVSMSLSTFLGGYTIRECYRPEWLATESGGRLELDFYIEELKVAIEVQGAQHYIFIPFFHGDADGFKKRLEADRYKKNKCEEMGIAFYEIGDEVDAAITVEDIYKKSLSAATFEFKNITEKIESFNPIIPLSDYDEDIVHKQKRMDGSRDVKIERREGGSFLVCGNGTKLFRFDKITHALYFYNKKSREEVEIGYEILAKMLF